MKILFADDDIASEESEDWIYKDLVNLLKDKKGIFSKAEIDVTRDGVRTHNALISKAYDRIILDIMMPVGEHPPSLLERAKFIDVGYILLKSLVDKKYKKNINIGIDVLTGIADPMISEKLNTIQIKHDKVNLFDKPISLKEIVNKW